MEIKDILNYINKPEKEITKKAKIRHSDRFKYFSGTAGRYVSKTWRKVCEAYGLHIEIIVWPKLEGKSKWESLEIEAKEMQENENE